MIELIDITKKYGIGANKIDALQGIDLSIPNGAFVSIVGASGSGKTTLMNIIGCLDTPTSGRYLLDGTEISALSREHLSKVRRQKIGFVFQSFNLLARLTALENVEMPLVFRGDSPRVRRAKAEEALAKVGLSHRLNHKPDQLSGGQQQRVAIARAIIGDPSVILADEPTGNLDTASGREILDLLSLLHRRGTTVLLITHDLSVAAMSPRTIRLTDGNIQP